jgi:predicted metal-dependent phosphotriesterase family hydrolase
VSGPSWIRAPWTSAATSSSWLSSRRKSGLRIVCTTGAYFEAEGITHTFRHLPVEDITAIYIKEITEGVGETGIRGGR